MVTLLYVVVNCIPLLFISDFAVSSCVSTLTCFHIILQSLHEGDCRNETRIDEKEGKVAREKRGRNVLKQARQQLLAIQITSHYGDDKG